MKNIFTLLVGGLLTTSAFAGNVTLTFSGNNNYQVLIDGKSVDNYGYSNTYSNTIYLNNLQNGRHSVQVIRNKKGLFGNKSSVVSSTNFNVTSQNDINLTVDNNGYVQAYESRNSNNGRNGKWKGKKNGNYDKHGNKDRDYDDDDRNYGSNGGYNNGDYRNGGYNNGYRQPMSDYDFNQLVQRIRNQWTGKFNTARDAVNANYFNTYQVRQILQLFSSENDKLDLAKTSYRNLVDQQNFRQLYDLFSYQSQSELDRYVRDYRY